uniref:OSJNBa0032F06.1 protein n=1 Tax=Oryza sativa subsp. japonica TaxID=39947 RepID=Q7X5Y2_ORYSJ|nr:OSJNBa0032F06.1 [Oryza sativa Japonica Group]CAE05743.1 OSJNBb0017I01.23 [Oryza sativa Japonica Group]
MASSRSAAPFSQRDIGMSLAVVGPLIITWPTRRSTVSPLRPVNREPTFDKSRGMRTQVCQDKCEKDTPRRNPGHVLWPGIVISWMGPSLKRLDPPTNEVCNDFISRQTPYSEIVDDVDKRLKRGGQGGLCGPRRNLVRLIFGNHEVRVRVLDLKIKPPIPPLAVRRRALEGNVTRLQAIPKSEPDATRYPVGFHPTQFIVKAKKIKERLYPDVGLTKMHKDAKEGDGIGVQMEKREAIEIQNQEKKFGRWREKTAENIIFDRNHATQYGLRISTSCFPLHGSMARKSAILLEFLQRCTSGS